MTSIEMYEWPAASRRPDMSACVDILEVPPSGQLPNVGDFVILPEPGSVKAIRYKVLEREHLWFRASSAASQEPAKWVKTILYVRREG